MGRRSNCRCLFSVVLWTALVALSSAPGAQVFFSDAGSGVIYRANLDGTGVRPVVDTGFTSWTMPIEVDPIAQRVYWAEVGSANSNSRIRSANYAGGDIQTLVDGSDSGRIYDLEFDQANQQLYWSDHTRNRLERIHVDGTGREDLTAPGGIAEIVGIALDIPNDAVYFTSELSAGIVGRYDLNSTVTNDFIDGPSECCSFGGIWDIELDPVSGALYFVDEDDSRLYTIGTDGTGFEELFEPSDGLTPLGLEIHGASLFIPFANTGTLTSIQLPTGDDDGFQILSSGRDRIGGVAIDPIAIPEPRAIGLLLVAVLVWFSVVRRRR